MSEVLVLVVVLLALMVLWWDWLVVEVPVMLGWQLL